MRFIPTSWLTPTHNELRNPSALIGLMDINSVIHYNAFYNPSETIQVIKVHDGLDDYKLFVNNGHHRITAAHALWGVIDSEQVEWKEYSIDDFLEVNLDVGWVTPYNPFDECRRPNFWKYKTAVLANKNYTAEDIFDLPRALYAEPRTAFNFGDLYEQAIQRAIVPTIKRR